MNTVEKVFIRKMGFKPRLLVRLFLFSFRTMETDLILRLKISGLFLVPKTSLKGVFFMKTKWQIYRQLELIPDTVLLPSSEQGISRFYQGKIWHSLVNYCTKNLSEQQTFDHLDACFKLDNSDPNLIKKFRFFQTIWLILNQPIQPDNFLTKSYPYIWKSSNFSGSAQWHIYDPQSGLTYDLDSEEDVLIWLEKRDSN